LDRVENALRGTEASYHELDAARQDLAALVTAAEVEFRRTEEQLTDVRSLHGQCPTCGQSVTGEVVQQLVTVLQQQLGEAQARVASAQRDLTTFDTDRAKLAALFAPDSPLGEARATLSSALDELTTTMAAQNQKVLGIEVQLKGVRAKLAELQAVASGQAKSSSRPHCPVLLLPRITTSAR
jgi:chromosome segregation ATPase